MKSARHRVRETIGGATRGVEQLAATAYRCPRSTAVPELTLRWSGRLLVDHRLLIEHCKSPDDE
jgi:hypothetical protein